VPVYPLVEFVLSVGTWDTDGEAYPDTGFEGGLALPVTVGREILADPDTILLRMADGTVRQVDAWEGELELNGRRFLVEVVALGSRCLLGREILDQVEICFAFGRQVRLRFADEQGS
jgi:predicted aspartyl protease